MALLIWFAYALFDLRLWEPSPGIKGYLTGIAMAILSSLIFLAINGRALARDGQTIGKRLNGIQIVKMDGSIPSLWDSFLIRYFCLMLIYQVPIFGGVVSLVGPLMIFRSSRRCLHDELAGTVVVKVA
jgi:uncharacterized RDD family membrane protein YckC